ncbi:uncharacterized protein LOC129240790 [Anastrepha obliqua]|uniref:uncharacterized protein LOC128860498 n=1 Tax=Anastrepha ludens TaxID=28586 RepID=UPI0023AFD373|nr:uncharacterized protein LOC128860498 [Anastrepha ludens]XP_054732756.1 uncharacterized protein LOC129240790 [Anastrepha obliqua]
MFQNSAARLLIPAIRNGLQTRCQSAVAGPPVNKVPKAELIILGGGMCASMLVVPAWVLLHMKDYRGGH